jgi:uncharacterized protein DUF5681
MATKKRDTKKKQPRGRPFAPGQSGNPGGRPKGLIEMRLAARAHTVQALDTLVRIMRSRKAAASARVRAVSELLDRAWGKPVQELAVQGAMAHIDARDVPVDLKDISRRMAFLLAAGAHGEKRAP